MDNVEIVEVFEALEELADKVAGDRLRELLELGEEGEDAASGHVLHEDVELVVLPLTAHVRHNIGMVQVPHHLDLPLDSSDLFSKCVNNNKSNNNTNIV